MSKTFPDQWPESAEYVAVLREQLDVACDRAQSWKNLHDRQKTENAVLLTLLGRLVANKDTRCRLDRHGYCQEHNFAGPCPVPEAQRLTGTGIEYVPNVGR